MKNENIVVRKLEENDDLEKVSELLYKTDEYIYPYWFGDLDNCIRELTPLLLEDKFFFNINNLYVAYDKKEDSIVGVVCIVDKDIDLDYNYKNHNYQ